MTDSPKPSWRGKGRGTRARVAPVSSGTGIWQTPKSGSARKSAFYHRLKLVALGLSAATLIAILVVYVVRIPKDVHVVSIVDVNYYMPVPPNAYALEDVDRLTSTNLANIEYHRNEFASDGNKSVEGVTIDRFDKALEGGLNLAKPGGPNRDVVMIYLSAHGVVDAEGNPCLLFSGVDPLDSATWLRVSDLLKRIKGHERIKQFPNIKVVLMLDSCRLDAQWNLGQLYNSFADHLRDAVAEANVPNLYILNSTQPGQMGLSAPELDGSVFGYFVAAGLSGHAAGADNKITLLELYKYLHQKVAQWSITNRARLQRPLLIPEPTSSDDFPLAFAGKRLSLEVSEEQLSSRHGDINQLFETVAEKWGQYDNLINWYDSRRTDPIGLAVLQHKLLRLEQLAMSGRAYRAEFQTTLSDAQRLLEQVGGVQRTFESRAFSLPLAQQLKPDSTSNIDAARLLQQWKEAGGRPPLKEGEPKPPVPTYLTAANVGWKWLADRKYPGISDLDEVLQFVDETGGRHDLEKKRLPDVVEIHFLRMLKQHTDRKSAAGDFEDSTKLALHSAIQARDLAERAAAPLDERVHYWAQPLLDDSVTQRGLDSRRRIAEDQVFVGDPKSIESATTSFSNVNGDPSQPTGYEAAIARVKEIEKYYALRDQVLADIPFLANWLTSQLRHRSVDQDSPHSLENNLLRLINETHELSAMLDNLPAIDEPKLSTEIVAKFESVQKGFDALRDNYLDICRELAEKRAEDVDTLRDIKEALTTPLLPVTKRNELTKKYLNILFDPAEFRRVTLTESKNDQAQSQAVEDLEAAKHVERLVKWERHPTLAILDRSHFRLYKELRSAKHELVRPESDVLWLDLQGGQVRRLLSEVKQVSNDLEEVTNRRLIEATKLAVDTRAGVSEADRLTRAAIPLYGMRTWDQHDPLDRLRSVDRYYQALWHSRRALDDFWGPNLDVSHRSYFDLVAERYHQLAFALRNDAPKSFRFRGESLSELRDQRVAAAQQVQVLANELIVDEVDDLTSSKKHEMTVMWAGHLPHPGEAAIFVRRAGLTGNGDELIPVTDGKTFVPTRRFGEAVAPPELKTTLKYAIAVKDIPRTQSQTHLLATCLFRGHVWQQLFPVGKPKRIDEVAVTPVRPKEAKVTVQGEGKQTGHIMFVIDCSGTMSKNGRMDTARVALLDVLSELQEQVRVSPDRYNVGLRAYGHRVAYADKNDLSKIQRSELGKDDNFNDPSRDVSPVVELRLLDDLKAQLGAIESMLNKLRPWGQTPLYHSIYKCFEESDFIGARKDEPKNIIVVTDGMDDPGGGVKLERPAQILELRKNSRGLENVQIDIVGLDLDLPDELKNLTTATGGRTYKASDTESLVKALRAALRMVKFSVAEQGKPDATESERLDLGQTWTINKLTGSPLSYIARLHGPQSPVERDCVVEGGEAIRIEYDRRKDELKFPHFEPREYDSKDDVRGDDPEIVSDPETKSEFYVQAMLPRRDQKNRKQVTFFIYVQNKDPYQFTPRPKHFWAEVQPVLPEAGDNQSDPPVYHFFDLDYVPDRPVPVFRFQVSEWPENSREAKIKLWLKFNSKGVAVYDEQIEDLTRPNKLRSLLELPEVTFQVTSSPLENGTRVTVVEQHPSGAKSSGAAVGILLPLPDEIRHRRYIGIDQVKHFFDYKGGLNVSKLDIQITPQAQIVNGAIQVPEMNVIILDR